MSAPESSDGTRSHRRRPRYPGKNPRRFDEKYKEHAPALYPDDVAKVVASGKTPAGAHRPIMVAEIIEVLRPKAGEIVVDCTLGYGGHAGALLKAIQPGGRLIGLDVDPIELPKTVARLGEMGFTEPVFLAVHRNFAGLSQTLADLGIAGADCILADLGVSSMQLDNPERGFTFKHDGPLDLRLNPARGISAADWLTRASVGTLAQALEDYADEPLAQLLARAILHAQSESPIQRTHQLAQMVRSWRVSAAGRVRGAEADLSVRRVFQALRIAVNDEFNALDAFLRNLPFAMAPGGRVAILTFHSGEDRRVKHAFRDGLRSGIYADVSTEVQVAGPEERRSNPRSAPAKLRWAVRTG